LGGDVLRDIFKTTEVVTCIDMHIHYSELHRFDTGLGERVLAYTLMGLLEIWWLNWLPTAMWPPLIQIKKTAEPWSLLLSNRLLLPRMPRARTKIGYRGTTVQQIHIGYNTCVCIVRIGEIVGVFIILIFLNNIRCVWKEFNCYKKQWL